MSKKPKEIKGMFPEDIVSQLNKLGHSNATLAEDLAVKSRQLIYETVHRVLKNSQTARRIKYHIAHLLKTETETTDEAHERIWAEKPLWFQGAVDGGKK